MQILMKTLIALTALVVASSAWAQPAAAQVDPSPKRLYQIKVMEGALVGAVSHGAQQAARQLQPVTQNMMLLTGMARARGFVLEGYGVFFDVEIPGIRESALWTGRMLEQEMVAARRIVDQLRLEIQRLADPQAKAALDQGLRRLEARMAPARQRGGDARTVADAGVAEAAPASPPAPPAASAPVIEDPGALYTESVKAAIINAMLDYGPPMTLQPEEWLSVAARDGEGPLTPLENYDAVTFIFRIKGSDLAAFRADRITREEAQKRVEVRQF